MIGSKPTPGDGPTICLLGGPLDTGNLGVSALGVAATKGILQGLPDARIILQNWGEDDTITIRLGERQVRLPTTGLNHGTRLWKRDGTRQLGVLAKMRGWLPHPFKGWLCRANRTFAQLVSADAVLGLCGGDSFSDTYTVTSPLEFMAEMKHLLLRMGKPLILLPQTFGPFKSRWARELARDVLDYCSLVATREIGGLEELQTTFGSWLPKNAVTCPDVAFGLDPVPVDGNREPFMLGQGDDRPLIGLNVSGLLYLSKQQFGLKEAYPRLIHAITEWALGRPDRRLVLIPHVISFVPPDQAPMRHEYDCDVSDTAACRLVWMELAQRFGDRVGCLGWPYTESETKFLIGRCEFVIGARMHACIAAISQGVPTMTQAYSKKARGVMGYIGEWAPVQDLRSGSISQFVEQIDRWYERRSEVRAALLEVMPRIRAEVERFFAECLRPTILDLAGRESTCDS